MKVNSLCVVLVLLAVDLSLDGGDECVSLLDHVAKSSTLRVHLGVLVLKLSQLILQCCNLGCVFERMYVCMYVCMYVESVCVCVCVCVCMCTCTHVRERLLSASVQALACMHMSESMIVHVYLFMYVHAF